MNKYGFQVMFLKAGDPAPVDIYLMARSQLDTWNTFITEIEKGTWNWEANKRSTAFVRKGTTAGGSFYGIAKIENNEWGEYSL